MPFAVLELFSSREAIFVHCYEPRRRCIKSKGAFQMAPCRVQPAGPRVPGRGAEAPGRGVTGDLLSRETTFNETKADEPEVVAPLLRLRSDRVLE